MSNKAFKFLFHNLRYPILAADTAMIALWTVCNVYNDLGHVRKRIPAAVRRLITGAKKPLRSY